MSISIDHDAPVVVSVSNHIDAPVEVVWARLSDLPNWPSWNTGVKHITLDGPVEVGTAFRWRTGPGTIRSTLLEVDPLHAIAWSGATMGIKAVHTYRLTPGADGGTDVATAESWDGFGPKLLRGLLGKALDKALRVGLDALKASAERTG